ncbi:kinetochore-associated Ndc80 complex subunit ndc80, variant 3 [Entomophthora muscae]|nr:kinetochore-associated Ndc80 complex subunit ndc80, variant 3 [Entomophthora muscae]
MRKSKELLENLTQLNPKTNNNDKDPRPLKDHAFQAGMMRHISQFRERMGLAPEVSNESFKRKETAAFKKVFQALYSLFDPAHSFKGNLKDQFSELLKRLGYPFISTLPKNIVEVVGSLGNWEKAIGLLDWMVYLLEAAESLKATEAMDSPVDFQDESVSFYNLRLLEEYGQVLTNDSYDLEGELQEIFTDRTKEAAEKIDTAKEMTKHLESELVALTETRESYKESERIHAYMVETLEKTEMFYGRTKAKHTERKAKFDEARQFLSVAEHDLELAMQILESLKSEAEMLPYTSDKLESMQQEKNRCRDVIKSKEEQLLYLQDAEKAISNCFRAAESLFVKAKSEFNSILVELDLGASYGHVDFVIPSDVEDACKFLETQHQVIKDAIFEAKAKASSDKHTLSQKRSQLESHICTTREKTDFLKGLCKESEQEITQLDFNYDKLKKENSRAIACLNSHLNTLKATIMETETRFNSEIIAIQEQVKLLESNQNQIKQLAAERIQKATSKLESTISFALHLKDQATKCIAEVKIQIDEVASSTESKLACLCETVEVQ